MKILRDLTEASELTVVLVEQNAAQRPSVAQRVVVLNLGKVVVATAPRQWRRTPSCDITTSDSEASQPDMSEFNVRELR